MVYTRHSDDLINRRRVAAVIVRNGSLLMVRERGRGPSGRHDGQEYWTLPGGGVDVGEPLETAVRREVAEEVGLRCRSTRYLYDFPYPSGRTSCFAVTAEPGEPWLGSDPDLDCECPRLVGLAWVPLPAVDGESGGIPVPMFIMASPWVS